MPPITPPNFSIAMVTSVATRPAKMAESTALSISFCHSVSPSNVSIIAAAKKSQAQCGRTTEFKPTEETDAATYHATTISRTRRRVSKCTSSGRGAPLLCLLYLQAQATRCLCPWFLEFPSRTLPNGRLGVTEQRCRRNPCCPQLLLKVSRGAEVHARFLIDEEYGAIFCWEKQEALSPTPKSLLFGETGLAL